MIKFVTKNQKNTMMDPFLTYLIIKYLTNLGKKVAKCHHATTAANNELSLKNEKNMRCT